jgi:Leucine-rich repeat (LRR) protein
MIALSSDTAGTSLKSLRVLWLNRSGMVSLDGLGSLSGSLEELYVAFNHIQDLSPLTDDDFDHLGILDIDSNDVADLEQAETGTSSSNVHI